MLEPKGRFDVLPVALKSEKHHWWPRCVSRHWAAADGKVGRIDLNGQVVRSTPEGFGVIRNAHHIKLDYRTSGPTVWDSSFEEEFDQADNAFPNIISWLGSLSHDVDGSKYGRFVEQPASDEVLSALSECVVSLVVRSPRNREGSVALAEHFRGPIESRERNALISLNMRQKQRMIADTIGYRAKFALLFSRDREFIFGDGFFHNLVGVSNPPHSPKVLVPLTPTMAVAITRPMSYRTDPRLVSIVLEPPEVERCNHAVQAYSKSELFFREEQPRLEDAFLLGKHVEYEHPDNPMETFLRSIPGVPDRDRSMDGFFGIA